MEQANINVFSFEEDFQKCAVCFPNYDAALNDDEDDMCLQYSVKITDSDLNSTFSIQKL